MNRINAWPAGNVSDYANKAYPDNPERRDVIASEMISIENASNKLGPRQIVENITAGARLGFSAGTLFLPGVNAGVKIAFPLATNLATDFLGFRQEFKQANSRYTSLEQQRLR